MAMNLQKAIVRNGAINAAICFVVSVVLGLLTGAELFKGGNFIWPVILASGIGLFIAWRTTVKIRQGFLNSLAKPISYVEVSRELARGNFNWETIDDYAVQLESRGYTRLGEFTNYPPSPMLVGVAACFLDPSESILVEVQHLQMPTSVAGASPALNGVHFSVCSVVGGKIRVVTTDHAVMATNHLLRGDHAVVETFPGMGLLALIEKHQQILGVLKDRTGKSADSGLTMERYILIQREDLEQARRRLEKLSGLEIARQVDAFDADPLKNWAPAAGQLAAVPARTLEELDAGALAGSQPPIIRLSTPIGVAQSESGPAAAPDDSMEVGAKQMHDMMVDALKQRVISGANWFYWIAALSLVNLVVGVMGSNWGFAIGLGISQILSGVAASFHQDGASLGVVGALYATGFAVTALFAAFGWYARRPSVLAFALGLVLFSIDSLIFLLASDWIGVAFHALALYFIWGGLLAARQLKKYSL
ncbi:hypothetical protein BH11PSE11_BH11PSE11_30140 [soil metagenome]